MTAEIQRQGLGSFSDQGFILVHPDDHTLELHHEGEFVARFSQTGATEASLQAECANHLVKNHGWDGVLFKVE